MARRGRTQPVCVGRALTELDGRQTHATSCARYQQPVAALQAAALYERVIVGEERHAEGGSLSPCVGRRLGKAEAGVHHHLLGHAAARSQTHHHRVAHAHVVHALADLHHAAAGLAAQRVGQRRPHLIASDEHEQLEVVARARAHGQPACAHRAEGGSGSGGA